MGNTTATDSPHTREHTMAAGVRECGTFREEDKDGGRQWVERRTDLSPAVAAAMSESAISTTG